MKTDFRDVILADFGMSLKRTIRKQVQIQDNKESSESGLISYQNPSSKSGFGSSHLNHVLLKRGQKSFRRLSQKFRFGYSFGGATQNQNVADTTTSTEHDCKTQGCERVRINISGQYYETRVGLLNKHPTTLLGDPNKRQRFYDSARNEFFIDRHRPTFEAIFHYYQYGGKLRRPVNVPDDVFLTEIAFFEIEKEVIEEYKQAEGYTHTEIQLPENEMMKKIWMLFEYPETSNAAFVIAVISVIFTVTSIILFCVETLPVFATTHCEGDEMPNFLDPFFLIETSCTIWFTVEAIVRFACCPNKLTFWKDFKNIVDVTAIIPYYVTFFNVISTMSCASAKSSASLAFLRVIRLVRVFKLTKHSIGLQVLILTFKASIEGLGLFLVALMVCLLVFSSAIYYAELGIAKSQIQSIPDAFWWSIITMTTVGYGDVVPVGPWGKVSVIYYNLEY